MTRSQFSLTGWAVHLENIQRGNGQSGRHCGQKGFINSQVQFGRTTPPAHSYYIALRRERSSTARFDTPTYPGSVVDVYDSTLDIASFPICGTFDVRHKKEDTRHKSELGVQKAAPTKTKPKSRQILGNKQPKKSQPTRERTQAGCPHIFHCV